MRRLNKVQYLSNQQHLILRVTSNTIQYLRIGQQIVTEKLTKVGRIFDIFGPINYPFISVQPRDEILEPEKLVGEVLYSFEKKKSGRKR